MALLYIPDTGRKITYSISAQKTTGTITKISGGIFENISVVPTDTTIKFPFNLIMNKALFMAKLSHRRCLL